MSKEETELEASNEFRMIITHALLGNDSVDAETVNIMVDGCTEYLMKELEKERSLTQNQRIERALNEVRKEAQND